MREMCECDVVEVVMEVVMESGRGGGGRLRGM